MTRQIINQTNTIVMIVVSVCGWACALRSRVDIAPIFVAMISPLAKDKAKPPTGFDRGRLSGLISLVLRTDE